jgi:D-galactarolactone cycloisomerase
LGSAYLMVSEGREGELPMISSTLPRVASTIRRIAALTSAHSVRLAPHAWGSGVLFAASIHVAMAAPNCHILEVSQGYMPMMWELFNEPFDIRSDAVVRAPDRPGLGFTLRPDALERFRYVDGPEYKF